jgi:hypothetical protein
MASDRPETYAAMPKVSNWRNATTDTLNVTIIGPR